MAIPNLLEFATNIIRDSGSFGRFNPVQQTRALPEFFKNLIFDNPQRLSDAELSSQIQTIPEGFRQFNPLFAEERQRGVRRFSSTRKAITKGRKKTPPPLVTVKQGDTVEGIAKRFNVSVAEVIAFNRPFFDERFPDLIFPGDQIAIPFKKRK